MNKNIYEIKLHEFTIIQGISSPKILVTRVAGGWLYSYMDGSPVFVPYNNEFMGNQFPQNGYADI